MNQGKKLKDVRKKETNDFTLLLSVLPLVHANRPLLQPDKPMKIRKGSAQLPHTSGGRWARSVTQ